MRIGIIGASGNIGRRVAQEAVERGPLRRIRVEDVRLTNPISLYTRKEPLSALAARFLDLLSIKR